MMAPVHQPAMVDEVVAILEPRAGRTLLDMTLGMGGHARHLMDCGAFVIGLDRDGEALGQARRNLAEYGDQCLLLKGRISRVEEVLAEQGVSAVEGCLLDAGISMVQMLDPDRGFSAHSSEALDMRMDRSQEGPTAFDVVNTYLEKQLAQVFSVVGDRREARRVVARIVSARKRGPITNTRQLAELIAATIAGWKRPREIDAAPYLMAIRAAVNEELPELEAGLEAAARLLSPGGKAAILTWNSAEHRVARQTLRRLEQPCACPPALPCVCGKKPVVKVLTKRPLYATAEEIARNPATRSVRLHAAVKLPQEADGERERDSGEGPETSP